MTNTSYPGPFPDDFSFGVATAAYQIEGAANEDGRKPSIWDAFSHTPGRVHNNDNGDIACDHYHLWESDLDLIKSMNMEAYRFSIAWPRVIPEGTGAINPAGLAFYDKLIDGCLQRGLKPFATLYHWDLPLQLQGHGGWTDARTAHAFADYARLIATHFGDRLASIATFNEPWCSAILSYLYGVHAPGETSLDATLAAVHQQHLGHGLAIQAIRAETTSLPLGIVLNVHSVYPADDSAQQQHAADRFFDFHNGIFLDPIFNGKYPQSVTDALGDRMPRDWQHDLATINQPLDFWGLNYYTPARVRDEPDAVFPSSAQLPPASDCETTDIGWEIAPAAFSDLLTTLYSRYQLPPCYITENGACYNDEPDVGVIDDARRISYLVSHLEALLTVINQGIPVKGYFAWSLMDNFEWAEGYRMRFGLVHVDYATQQRTLKNSGHWFSKLAALHRS